MNTATCETLPALLDLGLVRRFDLNGPRYTSYPTADRFHPGFGPAQLEAALRARAADASRRPLSIYAHLPFCNTVCFYCGCNKIGTRDKSRATTYVDYLRKEVELQAAILGPDRRACAMHWGGGTPTFPIEEDMRRLMGIFRENFDFQPGAEIAIEIDPRSCPAQRMGLLTELGFNRASFGIQDFDPDVQKAVNRIQPFELTRDAIVAARANGFKSVNADLIYGLPRQNVESFTRTVESVLELRPDRIALYSYAHLPTRFKPQTRIVSADLPTAAVKLNILTRAIERFNAAGYVYIGMDHFALPDDELARAQRDGTLIRNFQGYSVGPDTDLLAFGVSAIAKVGATYAQNAKDLAGYYKALDAGGLPVIRGVELTEDDVIRRTAIGALMCQFELDVSRLEEPHGIVFGEYFAAELAALQEFVELGLVEIGADAITVTRRGRYFVRAIAAVFDRYLQSDRERVAYSRII
jgi:oxygen-independent coproporphyrinogen-3 oxidase